MTSPKRGAAFERRILAYSMLAGLSIASAVRADATLLPPRSEWRASSSATETPAMASPLAIDGDPKTRWGGPFAGEHWLQVDLGSVASIGGVKLQWDSGFAASYRILASVDGREWQTVFETADGQGGIDYVFFSAVEARYLRLAPVPLSADWGVSLFEFEPLSTDETPRLTGMSKDVDPATLWGGTATPPRALGPTREIKIALPRPLETTGLEVWWGAARRRAELEGRDTAGKWHTLSIDREPQGDTSLLAARTPIIATELRLTVGAARVAPAIRRLRLLPPDRTMTPLRRYEVVASRVHSELFPLTLRNHQVYWTVVGVPAGRQKSIFDEFGNLEAWKGAPLVQPLWRDADRRLHAVQGSNPIQSLRDGYLPMPMVQWMPQPGLSIRSEAITVEQSGQPITLLRHRVQNMSAKRIEGELTLLVRPLQINPPWQNGGIAPIHEVALEGKDVDAAVRVNGRLLLRSLTPVQTRGAAGFGVHGEDELTETLAWGAPPTAAKARDYDGLAAAYLRYTIRLAPGETSDAVLAFPLGNERIDVLSGKLPEAPAIDRAALLAAARSGSAAATATRAAGPTASAATAPPPATPAATTGTPAASTPTADTPAASAAPVEGAAVPSPAAEGGAAFDAIANKVAEQWQERLSHVGISLPDHSLVDMLRAQVAYMLINQTGPAMQPGPRNYNRSFIRDGSATAEIMLRMGLPGVARDYLHWYANHAVHDNGLVSPILGNDGSVDRGFGSDLEFDSQGEFVWFVAQVARLDGGPQTVREYLPKVRLALQFLKQLRERTLVPGYQADQPAPERFRGIIAPSISHEGYSVPTHSYWDDYWGLKGWHDGAWLAATLGNADMDAWARTQYEVLRESVAESVRATMAWKRIDTVPASADLGDFDPTSLSIALDPCGQQTLLPADALQHTFDVYLNDVRKRSAPNSLWAFTPYELRNVLSYVHLGRAQDANELLTSLLRYRRPMAWQEFAEVVHSRTRHPGYLGDMPHTWVGTEYVRAIIGMLMHEADDHLDLLPGAPVSWLAGEGVSVSDLRTAYGHLTMNARQAGSVLRIELGPGLSPDIAVQVTWPSHRRPPQVWVDDQPREDQTSDGIRIERPFHELVARWSEGEAPTVHGVASAKAPGEASAAH